MLGKAVGSKSILRGLKNKSELLSHFSSSLVCVFLMQMEIIAGSSPPPPAGSNGLVLKLNIHYRWVVITTGDNFCWKSWGGGEDAVYIQYMTNKV
jgi:hypothetical protein